MIFCNYSGEVRSSLCTADFKKFMSSTSISTLQYFSRTGGLSILAQHLQLYHPSNNFQSNNFQST